MGTLMQDMRYGIRMLSKNPGFAIIAVLTLALGIGANTAIFSVVNAELLRPLPFRDSGRLVSVATANSHMHSSNGSVSYPDFMDWRSQNQVFEKMAAYTGATFTLTGQVNPAHLEGASVSAETFDLLGVSPELGRTFEPGEDGPNHHVVVISDHLWKQQFGGDPGIIGRTITIDNDGYTVVGVMPANFRYPLQREPEAIWSTLSPLNETTDNSPPVVQHRGAHFLTCIARLKPGVTLAQAQAAMDVIASSLSKQYPDTNKYMSVHLRSEQDRLTGSIRAALLVMMIAVGLVLLIACVNVANLLLARATTRGREIAIRTAMGAGRIRMVRQLVTESLLLAIVAGIFGAALAFWGSDVLVRLSPENLPRVGEIHIDGWALAFTAGLSLLTGILFGLAPALQSTHSNIVEALKEGSLSMTAGRSRHGLRSSLVIVEMALALLLLVSAGLLIRSLIRLQDVNPGFDPHNVMTASLDLPDAKYSDLKKAEFFRELIPQLQAIPGVQSAAAVFPLPMSGDEIRTSFQIEGRPVAKSDEPHTSVRCVTPNYFTTMRIPLLQGREFTEHDEASTAPVIIVNQAFAQQYFPGEDPIGKRIQAGISNSGPGTAPMREIIAVVGNVKFEDLTTEFSPESYIPYGQLQFGSITIVARSSSDPDGLAKPIASVVRSLDKDLPTYAPKTVEQYLDGTIAVPRFNTFLLAIFAALAMVLTAVGLYGVISYTVAQRTHEIGIRMALGAQPGDMMRLVVGQGMRLALVGVAVGLVAALGLTRFLSSLLFGVSSTDPVSFAAVVAMLFGVVLLACYIPARRAMRVDPMVALRYE
jgi:putative ABC transport system permease protein